MAVVVGVPSCIRFPVVISSIPAAPPEASTRMTRTKRFMEVETFVMVTVVGRREGGREREATQRVAGWLVTPTHR